MGIVTKILEEEGKDPLLQTIGVITLEDIIGELLN